jgi:hypothetical protein
MKQIKFRPGILLVIILVFKPAFNIAQLNLKTALICNNKQNELKYYDDGDFKLYFEQARFSSFITYDSSLGFHAEGKWLEIINAAAKRVPVKIRLEGNAVVFAFDGKETVIDSVATRSFSLNGIAFSLYKSKVDYAIAFSIKAKEVYLYIDIQDYPKNTWTWNMISIRQDSSSFDLGYNPFHDAGPSLISRQDERLRYGIDIAHSFKTNKYVWTIDPVFYEETPKSHVINILPDFHFEYNRRGKSKPKKCKGDIRYCDAE